MSYDGVVFDKDGTLVDSPVDGSMDWLFQARVDAARELGLEDFDKDDALKLVYAKSNKEIENFLDSRELSYEDLRAIEEGRASEKMRRVSSGQIKLIKGVKELLEKCNSQGVKMFVVSNGTQSSTDFTLQYLGISDFFEVIIAPSTDEIETFYDLRKPSPDMLEKPIDEMGARSFLMVGDSSSDIEAAERAGIDSVLLDIYDKQVSPDPDYRVKDIREILDIVE